MNSNEKSFIYLLSCFLSSKKPTAEIDDWKEIYRLADINNVVGIIANEIKQMPAELRPDGKLKSYFNQNLGKTVQRYDELCSVQEKIKSFFLINRIDFVFVKGSSVRELYPVPELRTSGDIDVIVCAEKYNDVLRLVKNSNYTVEHASPNVIVLDVDGVFVEIHKDADVLGEYFNGRIFDVCDKDGNEYSLGEYDRLLYVILHLAKHLKSRGAGIRMLLDVDACVRAIDNFDMGKFIKMSKDAGVEKCSVMLLALAKQWLDTPVDVSLRLDDDLIELLSKAFIHGGVFGFKSNSLGSHYVAQSASSNKIGFKEKCSALVKWLFPPASTVRNMYFYASKHNALIPFAYLNRFFDGVFLRGRHSLNTMKQIASSNDSATIETQILKELDIL